LEQISVSSYNCSTSILKCTDGSIVKAELQGGLMRFRDLLNVYQETKTSIEVGTQVATCQIVDV